MGAGHHHGHGHSHGDSGHSHVPLDVKYERPLWIAFGLTLAFLLVEFAGALLTNSLALLSDAAHMMTDVLALGISLFAIRMSRRPADARRTYGYARMEALGAVANGGLLFVVAGYILWAAIDRFREPPEVATGGMLAIAVVGLVVNLISMRLLRAGAGESLNIKGAYLEVWSDMLGSVGVILGALAIRYTGWTVIDPVLAVLIGLWVLPRTWVLVREALNVLMEGVPRGVDLAAVEADLRTHPGVADIHDLHVWALASRTPAMTAHVGVAPGADPGTVRRELAQRLQRGHGIGHVTLQMEADGDGPCEGAGCGTQAGRGG